MVYAARLKGYSVAVKIKVRPEDFQVEELAYLPLSRGGPYRVYLLKKWGWNTVDLLRRLSKTLGVPFKNFSYGGKKDRYALTTQYITIKDRREFNIEEKHYSLTPVGSMYRPMGPDLLLGNRFEITVRKLNEDKVQYAKESLKEVSEWGYINYFDDQRFGSFAPLQGFIAEKLLLEDYYSALKIILTHIYPEDKKPARQRKRLLKAHWGDWHKCLELAETALEKYIFRELSKSSAPERIIKRLPKEEISMYVAAFQSFLWNETARRILMIYEDSPLRYRGIAGDYLFYQVPDKDAFQYMKTLSIPVASDRMTFEEELSKNIFKGILEERGLNNIDFIIKPLKYSFPSFSRQMVVFPEELVYEDREDEVYRGYRCLRIRFRLPKGSYATMLLKRVFAKKL